MSSNVALNALQIAVYVKQNEILLERTKDDERGACVPLAGCGHNYFGDLCLVSKKPAVLAISTST
jgi:hypothetical protein